MVRVPIHLFYLLLSVSNIESRFKYLQHKFLWPLFAKVARIYVGSISNIWVGMSGLNTGLTFVMVIIN